MSKKFETRKRLKNVVRMAKIEILQYKQKIDKLKKELEENKVNELKELEEIYTTLVHRYMLLNDSLINVIRCDRKEWLNNKVNKNRLNAKLRRLSKDKK